MIKIAVMSDTHGRHRDIEVPDADTLVHCGDFSMLGQVSEVIDFLNWFGQFPHKNKVVVAGNHDRLFEFNRKGAEGWIDLVGKEFGPIHYLEDSEVTLDGVKFYGSPWTPRFGGWSFMKSDEDLVDIWSKIPEDVEVLITHGPPRGILDLSPYGNEHAGSQTLFARVTQLKQLKANLFGHIHQESGETHIVGGEGHPQIITFINAAICDEEYNPTNPVRLIEV